MSNEIMNGKDGNNRHMIWNIYIISLISYNKIYKIYFIDMMTNQTTNQNKHQQTKRINSNRRRHRLEDGDCLPTPCGTFFACSLM